PIPPPGHIAMIAHRLSLSIVVEVDSFVFNYAETVLSKSGAQEKTRTSTVLPPLGPEPSASTNSATWALQNDAASSFPCYNVYQTLWARTIRARPYLVKP